MSSLTINNLVEKLHELSKNKGFYKDADDLMNKFTYYDKYFTPADADFVKKLLISQKLLLIISEAAEATEALRKQDNINVLNNDTKEQLNILMGHSDCKLYVDFFEANIKDSFGDELADTLIRLLDLCGFLGIDIESHVRFKDYYNQFREYMHGKKF